MLSYINIDSNSISCNHKVSQFAMSRFSVCSIIPLSWFTICGKDAVESKQEAAIKKLARQQLLHTAQVNHCVHQITLIDEQKMQAVKQKNIALAKTRIVEKHKLLSQKSRFEQLTLICQRMLDNISDGAAIKDTVGVLTEVQSLFKGVEMDSYLNQIGSITDSMGEFKSDLDDVNNMISDTLVPVDNSALEAELNELLEISNDGVDASTLPAAPTTSFQNGRRPAPHSPPVPVVVDGLPISHKVSQLYN